MQDTALSPFPLYQAVTGSGSTACCSAFTNHLPRTLAARGTASGCLVSTSARNMGSQGNGVVSFGASA